jgi:hypothetical protein
VSNSSSGVWPGRGDLRDGAAELALVFTLARHPELVRRFGTEPAHLTDFLARQLYQALVALVDAGEVVTLPRLADRAGLRAEAVEQLDEEHFDPDARALREHILDLSRRRALRVVGEAARAYADDLDFPVTDSVRRLRLALEEVVL